MKKEKISAFGGKRIFLSTLRASIFLSALSFFMLPSGVKADYPAVLDSASISGGGRYYVPQNNGGWFFDTSTTGNTLKLGAVSLALSGCSISGSGTVEVPQNNGGWFFDISTSGNTLKLGAVTFTITSDTYSCPSGGVLSGTTCIEPINGSCGTSANKALTTAPATNLCADGSLPVVSGSNPWTWTCAGSNGGSNATCSTSAVGTCSAVAQVSTPQGYSCSSGVLNGTNCDTTSTYAATLSGGILFDIPIYNITLVPRTCRSGGGYNDNIPAFCDGFLIAYGARSNFTGAISYYQNITPVIRSGCIDQGSLVVGSAPAGCVNPVYAYASATTMTGVTFVSALGGYLAPSAGTYGGTYSCNAGDTLSGTTCTKTTTKPATPTYACSNVCSATLNNLKGDFNSVDAKCDPKNIIPGTLKNVVVDCNCGISAAKSNPIGYDTSSCTACTLAADGACGAANGTPTASIPTLSLCGLVGGNASPVLESAATWDWTCIGSSSTDLCSANKSCTPDYTHFWVTIDADSCDAGNAGTTIIEKKAQCNRTDNNNCGLGGFPASGDCNAVTKPADQTKLCPATRKIKSWQEVSPS